MKLVTAVKKKLTRYFVPCEENNYRPRFLAGHFLVYYLVALAILKIFAVYSVIYFPKTVFFADISSYSLMEMTNKARKDLGLTVLTENQELAQAAYRKAEDMMTKGYFSHKGPDGKTSWSWIREAGYDYQYAGENLAIGFIDAGEAYRAWYDSATHRANLLNPNYREIGISVVRGSFQGSDTYVVVQLFGVPKEKIEYAQEGKTVAPPARPEESVLPPETPAPSASQEPTPEPSSEAQPKETPTEYAVKGVTTSPEDEQARNSFGYRMSRFFIKNYGQIVQFVILLTIFLLIISLLVNVFVRMDVQFADIIVRTSVFLVILAVFAIFDNNFLAHLIPHQVLIY